MPWTKDDQSESPKVIYTAPASADPVKRVIYNPNTTNKWCIEYAYLNDTEETQTDIESLMGII